MDTEQPQPTNSSKLGIIILGVAALLVFGSALYVATVRKNTPSSTTPIPTQAVKQDKSMMEKKESPTNAVLMTAKTIEVSSQNFSFTPSEITVKKGETVKIVFTNTLGMHDFVIDDLGVRTPVVKQGEKSEVEFTPEKTGVYEYYCSVGNHRKMGMKGTLTVE